MMAFDFNPFMSNPGLGALGMSSADGMMGLSPEDQQRRQLLALASGLLQASGPSATPVSFGQALGKGLEQMQKVDSDSDQIKKLLLYSKLSQQTTPQWERVEDPDLGTIQRNVTTGEIRTIPKTKQQLAEESKDQGRADLTDVLDNLGGLYTKLDQAGGAVNTRLGPITNIIKSAQNSDMGQAVGRTLGTDNQSTRNEIAAQLPLISAAIKNATGMSSQQMNSNFELQQYMKALSNPKNDYQANMRILDKLKELYGTKQAAPQNPNAGGALPSAPGGINTQDSRVQKALQAGYTMDEINQYLGGR